MPGLAVVCIPGLAVVWMPGLAADFEANFELGVVVGVVGVVFIEWALDALMMADTLVWCGC